MINMIISSVTNIPANMNTLSSFNRRSIIRIVSLDRPKVVPMSKIFLCAFFSVSRWFRRLPRILLPDAIMSSTPRCAFIMELWCCNEWSMSICRSGELAVNLLFNNCSRSLSSFSRRCRFSWNVRRAASKCLTSYFSWSTRILALCRCTTGTLYTSTSSRSQFLKD